MTKIYETAYYDVILEEGDVSYRVVNKKTLLSEAEEKSLPRCMLLADEWSSFLARKGQLEEMKEAKHGTVIKLPTKDDSR